MVRLDQYEERQALQFQCVSRVTKDKLALSENGSAIRLREAVGRGSAPKSMFVVDSGANR